MSFSAGVRSCWRSRHRIAVPCPRRLPVSVRRTSTHRRRGWPVPSTAAPGIARTLAGGRGRGRPVQSGVSSPTGLPGFRSRSAPGRPRGCRPAPTTTTGTLAQWPERGTAGPHVTAGVATGWERARCRRPASIASIAAGSPLMPSRAFWSRGGGLARSPPAILGRARPLVAPPIPPCPLVPRSSA